MSNCACVSLLQRVRSRGLEEVVILNVDTNTLETPFDDLKRIPSDVVINTLCVGLFDYTWVFFVSPT